MAQFLGSVLQQLENSSGSPLSGAKMYVYQTGTTTALSLYSDEGLTTPLSNPVVADSSGAFAEIFLAETKAKVIITTSADVTVFTRNVVYTTGVASNIAAADVSYDGGTSGLASDNVQDAIDEVVELQGLGQEWTVSSDGVIAIGTSTNAGAAAGPTFELYRNSASPAALDVIGGDKHTGENAAGTKVTYSEEQTVILDTTNGSEDAKRVLRTVVAGSLADRLHIGAGVWGDGATGGDPGTGKANFTEVQRDGNGIQPLITGTAQATTSGTAFNYTSIPSWVTRITVLFNGVSLSGTDDILVQIGDSGGLETTSYVADSTSTGGDSSSTAGFVVRLNSAAGSISGAMTLYHVGSNLWVASHATGGNATRFGGGTKTLSATLDRLTITRTGTNTFDAGSVNIMYE